MVCPDFDLCEKCEGNHLHVHPMLRLISGNKYNRKIKKAQKLFGCKFRKKCNKFVIDVDMNDCRRGLMPKHIVRMFRSQFNNLFQKQNNLSIEKQEERKEILRHIFYNKNNKEQLVEEYYLKYIDLSVEDMCKKIIKEFKH